MNTPPVSKPAWNPWPWAIIGFFCLAVPTVVGFAVFASRQTIELVGKDYYEEELRFQQQIDAQALASRSSTPVSIVFDKEKRMLRISVPRAGVAGAADAQPHGSLELYRPSDSTLDRKLPLAPGPDGVQSVDVRSLRAGLWRLRLSWTAGTQDFYHADSIVIPPGA
ncbi:MAG TPA: hypothetical protein DCM86_10155 [Verrucomicrobiales bacterium]|nr:hypothetical protein [Verrucomicrobiales bacterium]